MQGWRQPLNAGTSSINDNVSAKPNNKALKPFSMFCLPRLGVMVCSLTMVMGASNEPARNTKAKS